MTQKHHNKRGTHPAEPEHSPPEQLRAESSSWPISSIASAAMSMATTLSTGPRQNGGYSNGIKESARRPDSLMASVANTARLTGH